MIIYTVFDPDDGSGLAYWWYGQSTVYVHEHGEESDAFEVGEPDHQPSLDQVRDAVEAHHASR